eukprot:965573-Pelagomonas_calceolata.AAC.5
MVHRTGSGVCNTRPRGSPLPGTTCPQPSPASCRRSSQTVGIRFLNPKGNTVGNRTLVPDHGTTCPQPSPASCRRLSHTAGKRTLVPGYGTTCPQPSPASCRRSSWTVGIKFVSGIQTGK